MNPEQCLKDAESCAEAGDWDGCEAFLEDLDIWMVEAKERLKGINRKAADVEAWG